MSYVQLPATDAARRADIGMMLAATALCADHAEEQFRLHVRPVASWHFDKTAPPGDQRNSLIEGSRCTMLSEHSARYEIKDFQETLLSQRTTTAFRALSR
jgi:hypothetical protein